MTDTWDRISRCHAPHHTQREALVSSALLLARYSPLTFPCLRSPLLCECSPRHPIPFFLPLSLPLSSPRSLHSTAPVCAPSLACSSPLHLSLYTQTHTQCPPRRLWCPLSHCALASSLLPSAPRAATDTTNTPHTDSVRPASSLHTHTPGAISVHVAASASGQPSRCPNFTLGNRRCPPMVSI